MPVYWLLAMCTQELSSSSVDVMWCSTPHGNLAPVHASVYEDTELIISEDSSALLATVFAKLQDCDKLLGSTAT